jgi:hypothetical protein
MRNVHFKSYNSTESNSTIAKSLLGVMVGSDNTPGASTNSIDLTINGTDQLCQGLPGTWDSAAAGSGAPFIYWFNVANPAAGIPVQNFDLTVNGTATATLLFIPA